MFEIDKEVFGRFVAEQRKEKGYTQKDLAGKLFVSDKAVSKWERGLSMPDISLLIPLADILEVSVTELLEGHKLSQTAEMGAGQVEVLVKKALAFSEDMPEKKRERRKKHAAIFGLCTLFSILGALANIWFSRQTGYERTSSDLLFLAGMSFVFGIYFWFFMKERLPVYYDENKINAYSDWVFRLNMPGMTFNNSNWPHIVRSLRYWSAITMVTIPVVCLLLSAAFAGRWSRSIQNAVLVLYLLGLFVPVYIAGKKYG